VRTLYRVLTAATFLAVAGCCMPGRAQAQGTLRVAPPHDLMTCSPAPCVLPPLQVSEGGYLVNTPSVAADPLNPKHLVLGANDFNCLQATGPLATYSSRDGGTTWQGPFCLPEIQQGSKFFVPSVDSAVGYDRNGVGYAAGGYFYRNGGITTGFVASSKSTDGVTWSQPLVALNVHNSQTADSQLVVDTNPGSPHMNTLYVSAVTIGPPGDNSDNQAVVAHSNDGGDSWQQATPEPVQKYPAADFFTSMTIGADGTVYLAWLHCIGTGPAAYCANGKAYMVFSKSSDGGHSWSMPRAIATVMIGNSACHCALGDLPNTNNVSLTNFPTIGIDNSNGPYAGNLYVVMYSWTGAYLRVQVVCSTDGGNTWSKPVPVAPPSDTHDQFFPWLSVSPTGLVGVSWLDRRNDPANVNYQAFAAISRDGGQRFQPNVQLTSAFSNPNVNGYVNNAWMGDYTGNTWAGPNFVAAWMDSSNGIDMQVMVGGIRLK